MRLADGQGSCLNYVPMGPFLECNWLKQMQLERKCVVAFDCAIHFAYVSFVYESLFGDRLDPYIRWLLVLVAVWWHGKRHQIKSPRSYKVMWKRCVDQCVVRWHAQFEK